MTDLQDLFNAVVDMQEQDALSLTKQHLEKGDPALDIFGSYQQALAEIGKRFEQGLYFIPELIMSGEMMQAGAEILKPHLVNQANDAEGNGQKKNWARYSWQPLKETFTISAKT